MYSPSDLIAAIPKHYHYQKRSNSALSFLENEVYTHLEHVKSTTSNVRDKKFEATSAQIGQLEPEKDSELYLPLDKDIVPIALDASTLNDFPARYQICNLEKHQFPAIGVYIDTKIVPGFKYRVLSLNRNGQRSPRDKYLFNGKSLTLVSIGRGYARRFTFENAKSRLEEENYFYSDNNSQGYAFELEAVFPGDKFTIFDANHEPQGILEIIKTDKKQVEISSKSHKILEKRINIKFTALLELYETGISQQIRLGGIAICHKNKIGHSAKITKITDVNINHSKYYLVPGYEENSRRLHVKGESINDVPTRYTITGLMPYEMPVIGTYVDPRILPGFRYRIRPTNRKRCLFKGKSLRLQSIGCGYAKKLTFESESALNPDNYLWSDNYQNGLALETRAVDEAMKFLIESGGQILGEATVFRADLPQIEERMEKIKSANACCYVKYVHVDVMCRVKMDLNDSGVFYKENLVRVYGLAVVRKEFNSKNAYLERIENIALDSQLNVLFSRTDVIVFVPV